MEFVTLSTLTEDPEVRMTMVSPGSSINLRNSGCVAVEERNIGGPSLGLFEGCE